MGAVILIFFLFLLIGGAAALVMIGLRQQREVDPLEARLSEYLDTGERTSLEEIELSQPFYERVVYPMAVRMGEMALRFTPQKALQDTKRKIEMAGNPRGMEPTTFFASRIAAAIGVGGLLFFVYLVSPAQSPFTLRNMGIILGLGVLGYFLPDMWLSSLVSRRQNDVRKSLPDALDLLTICVEAGLGFEASMKKVADKWDNELALAFSRALKEIQLGKLRREALRDMADRIGAAELDSFVAAVIQSEQLGVSMSKILRIQADDMRVKRRQRAEQLAQTAPIKMLFPMALLIFPTIVIVLMGPAVLRMSRMDFSGIIGG